MAEAGRRYKQQNKAKSQRAMSAPRNPRGQFLPNPASKSGMRRAAASAPTISTQQEQVQQVSEEIVEQIGIIDALIQQRKEMGLESSELETIVLGGKDSKGVRSIIESYKKTLSSGDPASAAAGVLLDKAAELSEESLNASQRDAALIYKKLQLLRKVAERTKGPQSSVVRDLGKIIAPVEDQLKKRASFGQFIKERAKDFKARIPETLASKVPVVGGILSDFFRQKRESKEQLEAFSGRLGERISEAGKSRTGGSRIPGGTRASDIPGLLGGESALQKREREFETRGPSAFPVRTFQAIQKDVESIKKAVSIIARRPTGAGGGGGGLFDMLGDGLGRRFFGRRSRLGRLFRRAKIASKLGLRKMKNLAGRGWRAGKNLLGRGWRAGKDMVGRGFGAVRNIAAKAFPSLGIGSSAANVAKSVVSPAASVGAGAASSAASAGSSAVSSAANIGTKAASTAAASGGGFFSSIWGGAKSLAGKVGSGFKAIAGGIGGLGKVVMGAIGPLLEAFFAWQDISEIKQNPQLSPQEKKQQIGLRVGKAIGSVIGSVGASVALGPAGPLVTSALDVFGVGPGALGEWLTEQLGAEKMYDLATSIPLIGSKLMIPEDQGTTAVGAEAEGGTEATGTITAPASANTTVGKMVNQYASESEQLMDAQSAAVAPSVGGGVTNNNSAVNTRVSNVTNNFNDDIRIRNNEATYKTMQMSAFMP